MTSGNPRAGGFTYLALLFFLAIMGMVMGMTGALYSVDRQREREADLLRAGRDLQKALKSYYDNAPPGSAKAYPLSLDDLVEDSRHSPLIRRHIRRIPLDPMTGTHDWGLKQLDGGQIIGVFSTSTKTPLKTGNFRPSEKDFASASSYSGWEFVAAALEMPNMTNPNAPPGGAPQQAPGQAPDSGSQPLFGSPSPSQGAPHNR